MPLVEVEVREGEPIEQALRRFNREVHRAGIIDELKKREYYEPPSVVKKKERKLKEHKIRRGNRYAS
jgi:small subunit ribosomal protein S21